LQPGKIDRTPGVIKTDRDSYGRRRIWGKNRSTPEVTSFLAPSAWFLVDIGLAT
jgi:hypothetical protein